ncbi:transposase [[Kitasatospora] papulosa]
MTCNSASVPSSSQWKARYAVRSGVEGTVNEFAHGHGMRRCRYRGQGKAHVQHVLTAIAMNIERLSGLPPAEEAPAPRRPTAFQNYRPARNPSLEVLAKPGHLTPPTPRSPTESSLVACVPVPALSHAGPSLRQPNPVSLGTSVFVVWAVVLSRDRERDWDHLGSY